MTTPATKTEELELHDPFEIPEDPSQVPPGIKAQMAFELRKAGAPYALVADKLGYKDAKSAENAIRRVLRGKYEPDDVEDVVKMELARLDALMLVAWRRAKDGDLAAIDRVLRIMEHRAEYLGLHTKREQAGTVNQTAIFIGGDQQDYIAQLQQVREMVANGQRPAVESGGT